MKKIIMFVMMVLLSSSVFAYGGGVSTRVSSCNNFYEANANRTQLQMNIAYLQLGMHCWNYHFGRVTYHEVPLCNPRMCTHYTHYY